MILNFISESFMRSSTQEYASESESKEKEIESLYPNVISTLFLID